MGRGIQYEALQLLTNDGQTFFYLLASGHVVSEGEGLYRAAYANLLRRFFTFDQLAATAKPGSLHLVQCLNPATGHLRWSRPTNSYDFQKVPRTADGFALDYRTGPELDYMHRALLPTTEGRELHDFQRKRLQ